MNCYVSFAYGVNMFSRLLYEIEPGNGVGLFWTLTCLLTYLLAPMAHTGLKCGSTSEAVASLGSEGGGPPM